MSHVAAKHEALMAVDRHARQTDALAWAVRLAGFLSEAVVLLDNSGDPPDHDHLSIRAKVALVAFYSSFPAGLLTLAGGQEDAEA